VIEPVDAGRRRWRKIDRHQPFESVSSPMKDAGHPGNAAAPARRSLFFAVFPSIMLPMFLAVIDQTIVATALPAIAVSLGEVERVSWVVISYRIGA
jgi:hypothetical protein